MTQSEEDPRHEVYPHTDSQIKLHSLVELEGSFWCYWYAVICTHKFSCLWHFFQVTVDMNIETKQWQFFTISWYDLSLAMTPLAWVCNSKHSRRGRHTVFSAPESMGCSESRLGLPPFASALVTLCSCSLAHQWKPVNVPCALRTTGDLTPLTTPKFHGSQALFSQLPSLFLLEWVTEACSDEAPFPGELSRSVCVCVCVFVRERERERSWTTV